MSKKTLIAYFSRSGQNHWNGQIRFLEKGNTKKAAEILAELTGGDLLEIKPVEAYPDDYGQCIEAAKTEKRENARPAVQSIPNPEVLNSYDEIYLGYPNWWGTAPMAVFTFLEQAGFKDQPVHPFCTHEGSGLGTSMKDLKKLGLNVQSGLDIIGHQIDHAAHKIAGWIA